MTAPEDVMILIVDTNSIIAHPSIVSVKREVMNPVAITGLSHVTHAQAGHLTFTNRATASVVVHSSMPCHFTPPGRPVNNFVERFHWSFNSNETKQRHYILLIQSFVLAFLYGQRNCQKASK